MTPPSQRETRATDAAKRSVAKLLAGIEWAAYALVCERVEARHGALLDEAIREAFRRGRRSVNGVRRYVRTPVRGGAE